MYLTLIDPNLAGHHVIYLKHIIETLEKKGHQILVLSSEDYLHYKGDFHGRHKYCKVKYIRFLILSSNFLMKKLRICMNLLIFIYNILAVRCKTHRNDKLFFCGIDDYMHDLMPTWLIEWLLPRQFSGLLLDPRSKTPLFNFDKRNILKSKYCKSVAVLDEFCNIQLESFNKNIVYFPDFSDESSPNFDFEVVAELKARAKGRIIISLLGALAPRKGYKLFSKLIEQLSSDKYFFLIAGASSPYDTDFGEVKKQLLLHENCLLYNKPIPTESDFNALVASSSIIFAIYENFRQSSNMLAKASLFERPLLVSKGYYMEEVVSKYKIGYAVDHNDAKSCAEMILQIDLDKQSLGFKEYLSFNSVHSLDATFDKIIQHYD